LSQAARHAAKPTARTTHVHEGAAETRADAGTEPTTQRKLQSTLLILLRLVLLLLLGVGSLLLLLSLL
jgi:hypothetical protein